MASHFPDAQPTVAPAGVFCLTVKFDAGLITHVARHWKPDPQLRTFPLHPPLLAISFVMLDKAARQKAKSNLFTVPLVPAASLRLRRTSAR